MAIQSEENGGCKVILGVAMQTTGENRMDCANFYGTGLDFYPLIPLLRT